MRERERKTKREKERERDYPACKNPESNKLIYIYFHQI